MYRSLLIVGMPGTFDCIRLITDSRWRCVPVPAAALPFVHSLIARCTEVITPRPLRCYLRVATFPRYPLPVQAIRAVPVVGVASTGDTTLVLLHYHIFHSVTYRIYPPRCCNYD